MKSPLPSTHFQCDALPPYLRGSPSSRYPPHKPSPSNSLPSLPCSLKLHRSIDTPKQGTQSPMQSLLAEKVSYGRVV
ncbi:uncharacterized protein RCO7_14601 [Rhynchosporium graminicola]|uniref:Uncharacterized protein n=1 Tax=Rhynchosporium graminicola TaxID=2792576 RepID=A0A1E1KQS2_9HELO|nr:uncharacterized protein RCO7_14601 [Rhynchosporium commune]